VELYLRSQIRLHGVVLNKKEAQGRLYLLPLSSQFTKELGRLKYVEMKFIQEFYDEYDYKYTRFYV
jgi:hypothetical protein